MRQRSPGEGDPERVRRARGATRIAAPMPLLAKVVLSTLPHVPAPLMRQLASRYIAGETLVEALSKLSQLAREGYPGILDILGEEIQTEAQAREVVQSYRQAADALAGRRLDAYLSVKPTHVGLRLSEKLALELYGELARHAAGLKLFVRVEMEDHTTTDATLRVFEALRREHANVGIVLQSRLLRTPGDIGALAPGPLAVRVVKGIYLEPAAIAHVEPEPIRQAYLECSRLLLQRGARLSFATHDDLLAEGLIELVRALALPRDGYEFQVLLGVREPLWERWRSAGHPVRVYVPFGPEWRPYSLRRMRKNPQILWHVVRQTLRVR
jgi:proline dehydrogenase